MVAGSPAGPSTVVEFTENEYSFALAISQELVNFTVPVGLNWNEQSVGEAITVPLPGPDELLRVDKLSKRYDCDISGLSAGLWLQMQGGVVADARFAFGGLAGIVKRAAGAEAAVRGQPWTAATVQAAMAALDADFTPMSDQRASAGYRQRAARNLLQRLWLATRVEAPLAEDQLSVWSAA